jgi:hypothetical protein
MADATEIKIVPKGDVLFELSDADHTVRLLVFSKILSLVSPVFATMFASKFKEGLHDNAPSDAPPIVALPEDDAEAFTLFCKLSHHQTEGVPTRPSTVCLEKFAVICDKYDCVDVFSHAGSAWLQARLPLSGTEDRIKLLNAAFLLNAPDAAVSWEILMVHKGSFFRTARTAGSDRNTGALSGMLPSLA